MWGSGLSLTYKYFIKVWPRFIDWSIRKIESVEDLLKSGKLVEFVSLVPHIVLHINLGSGYQIMRNWRTVSQHFILTHTNILLWSNVNSFYSENYTITGNTEMILSFLTDRSEQTLETQNTIRIYTVCHFACIFWTYYSMVKTPCSNVKMITKNFGCPILRIFTILYKLFFSMSAGKQQKAYFCFNYNHD